MSRSDDFSILTEDPNEPPRQTKIWLWLLIAAAAIFVFAVGMALATFSNRMGNAEDADATATALALAATATPTAINAVTTPETATATLLPTATTGEQPAQPTATTGVQPAPPTNTSPPSQPTATLLPPTATATIGCNRAILAQFSAVYRAELGCAVADAGIVWSAWEWFERGAMFWRDDNDRAYAFFNDGSWRPIDEKWEGQDVPSRGDPPTGLRAPERGFGYAWGRSDELFQRLGWATDQERGFCAVIQNFEHGFILQDSDIEACKDNLFNQARTGEWRPLYLVAIDNGQWVNWAGTPLPTPVSATPGAPTPSVTATLNPNGTAPAATATATVAAPTPTESPTVVPTATEVAAPQERPAGSGLYNASSAIHTLDGNFADWGNDWHGITAVVGGNENYSGVGDSSGDFQVTWSLEGLYLALRINDDRYRPGPNGTDMWQGDAIEIHFDRQLGTDYIDTLANEDDYQLGLSWGPERNEVRLYRWLPLVQEGAFPISGAVLPVNEGYQAEVLIPWTLFDVTSGQLQPDQRFGFTVSISDNDADNPSQETVLSTSPNRTTYNNPTEWGTLILR